MRPGNPAQPPRPLDPPPLSRSNWREPLARELPTTAAVFLGNAAFPRLAYRLRWPTRLRGRGLVAYVGFKTLEGFWLRQWLMPMLKRTLQLRQRLADELGREPTADEIRARLLAIEEERRAARRARFARLRRPRAARRATRSPGG
jgi:hypothetical protein